ncbi:MAG: SLOG family protein [Clostridium butyricum]
MITVAFTGHRPDKLGGYNWQSPLNQKVTLEICHQIGLIFINNPTEKDFHFICGGAIGTDQFAFDCVEFAKEYYTNLNITIEVAVPFKKQAAKWFQTDQLKYNSQLNKADKITYVDTIKEYVKCAVPEGEYHITKMQQRNEYMVDNADIVIAVWNGDIKGGTYNCYKYAKKLGKDIVIINPKELMDE